MKVKAIVAGIALAFSAGAANAAIIDSELFLNVNKQVGATSIDNETYILDLGLSMTQLRDGVFTYAGSLFQSYAGGYYVDLNAVSADWGNYDLTGANAKPLTFNLAGQNAGSFDINGAASGGTSTAGAYVTSVNVAPSGSNPWGAALTNPKGAISNRATAVNTAAGVLNDPTMIALNSQPGDYDNVWGNNLNGTVGGGFDNDITVDGVGDGWLSLFIVGKPGTLSPVTGLQLAYSVFLDVTNDRLVFSSTQTLPTSAVPVPGALWLLGSSLLGFIGLGSRKNKVAAA